MLCETQPLLVSASIKGISMIGRTVAIPDFDVEIPVQKNDENDDAMDEDKSTNPQIWRVEQFLQNILFFLATSVSTKFIIFGVIFGLLRSSSVRAKIREDAVKCLGSLAIGDGEHFTSRNLDKFLSLVKVQKDAALNIAISEAIVATINGYDPNCGPPSEGFVNQHCDDKIFEKFLMSLIKIVTDPNPHSRQVSYSISLSFEWFHCFSDLGKCCVAPSCG